MTIETVLSGAASIMSLATLGAVLKVGVDYGKRTQIQDRAVEDIAEIKTTLKTVLGNGAAPRFVEHGTLELLKARADEEHERMNDEIDRHRTTLEDHGRTLQRHEVELATLKEGS